MSMENAPLTIRDMIEPAIMAAGGWVNTHAHADRAYTLSPDVLELRRTCTLQQKWDALDRLKRESTEEIFYRRFCTFFENQIAQGVTALATFVDIDPQSEDRAIKAGLRAREHYKDQLTVKFANQTLKGVIDPEARRWFDIGAELVDIIGALPKRDERDFGKGSEAFDIIMETAKRLDKIGGKLRDAPHEDRRGAKRAVLPCEQRSRFGTLDTPVMLESLPVARDHAKRALLGRRETAGVSLKRLCRVGRKIARHGAEKPRGARVGRERRKLCRVNGKELLCHEQLALLRAHDGASVAEHAPRLVEPLGAREHRDAEAYARPGELGPEQAPLALA